MRLDANQFRFMTKDEFRVLTAVEMGMKNHELVPVPLIESIASLKRGGCFKIIAELLKNKLLAHDARKYNGYKLTYMGLDYLAMRVFVNRGTIAGVGRRIGVGKESDIYECVNEQGEIMAMKIHRLGRVSFKNVKSKRDYLLHRKSASWMYMSRLAAVREYTFMQALHAHEFPTPTPIDQNRHCIVMSMVNARPFGQVRHLKHPARLYNKLMNLIVRVAEHGLIHGDFNEFNLMINDQEVPTLIDFPQMVSTSHENAAMFFERDVNCIRTWFGKRFNFFSDDYPIFATDVTKNVELDISLAASGFSKEEAKKLESYFEEFQALEAEHGEVVRNNDDESDDDEDEDGEDDEEAAGAEEASASAAAAAEDDEDADLKPNANRTRKMYSKEAVAAELRRASAVARANGAFADADDDEDDDDDDDEDDDEDEEEEEVEIDEMLRKRDRVSQMVPKVKSAASSSAAAGADEEVDEVAVQAMIKQHLLAQRQMNASDAAKFEEQSALADAAAAAERKKKKKAAAARKKKAQASLFVATAASTTKSSHSSSTASSALAAASNRDGDAAERDPAAFLPVDGDSDSESGSQDDGEEEDEEDEEEVDAVSGKRVNTNAVKARLQETRRKKAAAGKKAAVRVRNVGKNRERRKNMEACKSHGQ